MTDDPMLRAAAEAGYVTTREYVSRKGRAPMGNYIPRMPPDLEPPLEEPRDPNVAAWQKAFRRALVTAGFCAAFTIGFLAGRAHAEEQPIAPSWPPHGEGYCEYQQRVQFGAGSQATPEARRRFFCLCKQNERRRAGQSQAKSCDGAL